MSLQSITCEMDQLDHKSDGEPKWLLQESKPANVTSTGMETSTTADRVLQILT
jgi:hypothetical protein